MIIVFDDIIENMKANKKLSLILTDFLSRERKLNISLIFLSQSYFKVPKTLWRNGTLLHYSFIKIPNKRELQQIASNHSSDTKFKDFMKLYKYYTKEPY